ncbi:hypothetical protein CYLTODRAFT_325765, partial [Cylindrobasidium torrendii FP15055 ss-10]
CTRWFLPLLLLPFPSTSSYFLLLFVFSMTMHAKPCFYCIVLISSLCVSSCYWQPFSIDTPLAAPWEQNVTTYREALVSQIPNIHSWRTNEIPDTIRPVDRCWCDLSGSSIFDRFNVSRWEYNTVYKLKQDLVK